MRRGRPVCVRTAQQLVDELDDLDTKIESMFRLEGDLLTSLEVLDELRAQIPAELLQLH